MTEAVDLDRIPACAHGQRIDVRGCDHPIQCRLDGPVRLARHPSAEDVDATCIAEVRACRHCGSVLYLDHPDHGVFELCAGLHALPPCVHGAPRDSGSCPHPEECHQQVLLWGSVHVVKIDGRRVWGERETPVRVCLHCAQPLQFVHGLGLAHRGLD
jgi:hypothetical protein